MDILVVIISASLFIIGGSAKEQFPLPGIDKKPARIFALPLILAVTLAIKMSCWWNIFVFGTLQILRIGYGEDSVLHKFINSDWGVRAAAGFLYGAIGGSIPFYITGNLQGYLTYVGINTVVNGVLNYLKAPVMIMETGAGVAVASILWLI